ncbi:hypothetical protein BGZ94_001076, partial [Podila epigama]
TPCSILLAISLEHQNGTNWSSWLVYAVTATLQACLLIVCLVFFIRKRTLRPATTTTTSVTDGQNVGIIESEMTGENTPLLPTSNTAKGSASTSAF